MGCCVLKMIRELCSDTRWRAQACPMSMVTVTGIYIYIMSRPLTAATALVRVPAATGQHRGRRQKPGQTMLLAQVHNGLVRH
jgi:hypothetical protein